MKLISIIILLTVSAFARATPTELPAEIEKVESDRLIDEVIADVKSHDEYKIWFGYKTIEESAKRVIYKHNLCNLENVEEKISCEDIREPAINRLSRDTYYSDQASTFRAEIIESKPESKATTEGLQSIALIMIVGGLIVTMWAFLDLHFLASIVFICSAYSHYKSRFLGVNKETPNAYRRNKKRKY